MKFSTQQIIQHQSQSWIDSPSFKSNQQPMTCVQKATFIINSLTNSLCNQIKLGRLQVRDQEIELPLETKFQPATKGQILVSKMQEIDIEEHRAKVKNLMEINRKMRQKRSKKFIEFEKSLKKSEQQEKKQEQQQKQQQLQKRRLMIENRLIKKAQIMQKIRQMSFESDQRIKSVKNKKFLYQQKQQEFKVKFQLPKIEQQRKILEKRKHKMKSIDINEILQHQKNYQAKKRTSLINRSLTSKFIESQTLYNPPQYVSKSYLLYQAQQSIKKQQKYLKMKQTEANKEKMKQFVKNISQIQKSQKRASKSLSQSDENKSRSKSALKSAKEKPKKIQLSKSQTKNIGNQYFKALIEEIKKLKQTQQQRKQQKQSLAKQKQTIQSEKNIQQEIQLEIQQQQIRTIQKVQKIQRSYLIRSKKIQTIFNDNKVDPIFKYQQLKHQVQNFDLALKTKNLHSKQHHERTEAAACYLNAIKAKIKLLEVSNLSISNFNLS